MAKRDPAQKAAEKAYRQKFAASVLVRFTEDEVAEIDRAKGKTSRPEFVKTKALAAAKRSR